METATEKIIRMLLFYPGKKWKQSELARKAGCSKVFVSKLMKRFVSEGIVVRPKPQEIMLMNNAKLLNVWCSMRKLPEPVYIKTKYSKKSIEARLKKGHSYSLTLFSAAWQRIKFMKTNKTELYVEKKNLGKFIKTFGKRVKSPTSFVIFPSESSIFEFSEKKNGLHLVHIIQNYVDLISVGGTGVRVARELDKKYNLVGI